MIPDSTLSFDNVRAFRSKKVKKQNARGVIMRNPVENISLLPPQINVLTLDNQILKTIFVRSGLSYTHDIASLCQSHNAE